MPKSLVNLVIIVIEITGGLKRQLALASGKNAGATLKPLHFNVLMHVGSVFY